MCNCKLAPFINVNKGGNYLYFLIKIIVIIVIKNP
jgi:hypothetical protein